MRRRSNSYFNISSCVRCRDETFSFSSGALTAELLQQSHSLKLQVIFKKQQLPKFYLLHKVSIRLIVREEELRAGKYWDSSGRQLNPPSCLDLPSCLVPLWLCSRMPAHRFFPDKPDSILVFVVVEFCVALLLVKCGEKMCIFLSCICH